MPIKKITALYNSYKSQTSLFVNGRSLQSQEGTNQGDPIAMAMYGIALLPLIELVKNPKVTQKWYADDSNVAGSMDDLKVVYDKLTQHGSAFGYTLTKCNIITKTENVNQAEKLFSNSDLEIVEGQRVLGSVIGSESSHRLNRNLALQNIENMYLSKKSRHFITLTSHKLVCLSMEDHCNPKRVQPRVILLQWRCTG